MASLGHSGVRPIAAYQCLAELYNVLVKKAGKSRIHASERVLVWRTFVDPVPTDESVFDIAFELASEHQLQIYDAIIFAAAVDARCDLLLSEDLQDGFSWRGIAIANPFAANLEPWLARLLA